LYFDKEATGDWMAVKYINPRDIGFGSFMDQSDWVVISGFRPNRTDRAGRFMFSKDQASVRGGLLMLCEKLPKLLV
jgi:hypothetical protein